MSSNIDIFNKFAIRNEKSQMNIIVRTAEGKYIVRPDTTWERDNEDIYIPEFVNRITWTPVLFARVSKPGRSVGEEFAERYYDGIGYGVLLYPEDMCDGSETGFACASCLDHTSFLPFPVYNKVTLDRPENMFELSFSVIEPAVIELVEMTAETESACSGGFDKINHHEDGFDKINRCKAIFSHAGASSEAIRKAIAGATRYIYIRTGDIIAIELQPRSPLCARENAENSAAWAAEGYTLCSRAGLKAAFCENETIDFDIIL